MGVRDSFNKVTGLNTLENQGVEYEDKVSKMFGKEESKKKTYNPFLKSDGSLVNKYIDYQKLLDNPNVSANAKKFIREATGLAPTVTENNVQSVTDSKTATGGIKVNTNLDAGGYTPQSTSVDISDATAKSNLVNAAQKYIGTPYVWGGESSAEGGFDCSGFVYNALKDAGYKVGRTTANGYRSYGSSVSRADMQPGDLVFYGKDGKATHIGIYIGNGQMIHSSGGSKNNASNPGKGVEIKNIDYRSDFLEARRY